MKQPLGGGFPLTQRSDVPGGIDLTQQVRVQEPRGGMTSWKAEYMCPHAEQVRLSKRYLDRQVLPKNIQKELSIMVRAQAGPSLIGR